jgi:probable HAF family extracellular repeat protein
LRGGADYSFAFDINNNSQVVGQSGSATGTRGFVWDAQHGMQNIGTMGGAIDFSTANGINDAGQITGYSYAPGSSGERAFLWNNGSFTNLGTLPGGGNSSVANAINNLTQVVGYSAAGAGNHAFLWDAAHGMQDLGALSGGADYSLAFDINNHTQVIGYSGFLGAEHAFVEDPVNGMQDLNNLVDSSGAGWILRDVRGINDAGQIVGYRSVAPDGQDHAFLLTPIVPEPSTWALLATGAGAFFLFGHRYRWGRNAAEHHSPEAQTRSSVWHHLSTDRGDSASCRNVTRRVRQNSGPHSQEGSRNLPGGKLAQWANLTPVGSACSATAKGTPFSRYPEQRGDAWLQAYR